ncbi:MAG: hypothetical protein QXS32_08435 [Candidatus Nezhaarchaeales archaeon]
MAKVPEVKWEDIRIWSTQEITIYPEPGKAVKVIAVTYSYKDYPPRTIWVDKDKYTRENVLRAIKEDLSTVLSAPALPPL